MMDRERPYDFSINPHPELGFSSISIIDIPKDKHQGLIESEGGTECLQAGMREEVQHLLDNGANPEDSPPCNPWVTRKSLSPI